MRTVFYTTLVIIWFGVNNFLRTGLCRKIYINIFIWFCCVKLILIVFEFFWTDHVQFCILPCGGIGVDSDTVWNEMHTYTAVRMVRPLHTSTHPYILSLSLSDKLILHYLFKCLLFFLTHFRCVFSILKNISLFLFHLNFLSLSLSYTHNILIASKSHGFP